MYKRILVPLDGSTVAEQILPHVIGLANRCKAEVMLLMVFPPLVENRSPEAEQAAISQAHTQLEGAALRVQQQGITCKTVVQEGQPQWEIIDYAKAHDIDLIAMSANEYSELQRWLVGSITSSVICNTPVPILLIKPETEV